MKGSDNHQRPGNTIIKTVSLPPDLCKRVNALTGMQYTSFSHIVRLALSEFINRHVV